MDQFLALQTGETDKSTRCPSMEMSFADKLKQMQRRRDPNYTETQAQLDSLIDQKIDQWFTHVKKPTGTGFSLEQYFYDGLEDAKRFFKEQGGLALFWDQTVDQGHLGLEDYHGEPYPEKPAEHDLHAVDADDAFEEFDDIVEREMNLEAIEIDLDEIGGINAEIAGSIESVMPGILSKRCNLRSFTDEISLINYNASLEELDNVRKGLAIAGGIAGLAIIIKIVMWVRGIFKKDTGSVSDATAASQDSKTEAPKLETGVKEFEQQLRTVRVDQKQMSVIIDKMKERFGQQLDVPERAGDPAVLMERMHQSIWDKFLNNYLYTYVYNAIKKDNKQTMVEKFIGVANVLGERLTVVSANMSEHVVQKEPFTNPDQYKIEYSLYGTVENFSDSMDSRELVGKLDEKLGALTASLTTKSKQELSIEDIYRTDLVSVFTKIDEKAIEGLDNLDKKIKEMADALDKPDYPQELKKSYLAQLRVLTDHYRAYGNIMRMILMARHRITKFEIELSKVIRKKQVTLVGGASLIEEVLLDQAPPSFSVHLRNLFGGSIRPRSR